MTLILNEIHILDGLENTFMIAAADRMITYPDGSHKNWKKLFEVPYFRGAISYFGLAEFPKQGNRELLSFTSWLPNFISKNSNVDNIKSFCLHLRDELNNNVPASYLKKYPSGFHICGYDKSGYPDFWSLTNIGKLENFKYSNFKKKYQVPANDLRNGELQKLGWDGSNPHSVKSGRVIFRNGDLRAHGVIFNEFDKIYGFLSNFKDFQRINTLHDYKDFVSLKFSILSYIYKKMTKEKVIGGNIDVILLEKPSSL
jgi:hypothetical protein